MSVFDTLKITYRDGSGCLSTNVALRIGIHLAQQLSLGNGYKQPDGSTSIGHRGVCYNLTEI